MFLGQCTSPHLTKIDLGGLTGINDEGMRKICLLNPLSNLEEFHCEKSSFLSVATVNLLLNNCDKLKAISDLQNWSELDPAYLGNLMERYYYAFNKFGPIFSNNYFQNKNRILLSTTFKFQAT